MKLPASMHIFAGSLLASVSAFAAGDVKIWSGSTSATWDTTTSNWTQNGTPCAFATGDDVRIDDTSSTAQISGSGVNPGNVEIDITRTLELTGNLFGSSSGEVTKNGSGTLILTPETTWADYRGNLHKSLVINAGVVQGGKRGALATYSDPKDSTITVNNGGMLWLNHHCDTGNPSDVTAGGAQTLIVNAGGTVDFYTSPTSNGGTKETGCHPIGSLLLNGGNVAYGRGIAGFGFAEIRKLLSFAGSVTYDLEYDRSDSRCRCAADTADCVQQISLHDRAGKGQVEISVAEISGDSAVDVRLGVPLVKGSSVSSAEGFRKTGEGTLQFATNFFGLADVKALDGTIRIEKGILDLAYCRTLDMLPEREVYVGTNAELKVSAVYALGSSDEASVGKLNVGKTTVRVDHGVLKLANPGVAGQRSYGQAYDANNFVGGLILDHATFDYSAIQTGCSEDFGWLTLGKVFEVVSDSPYVFEPVKTVKTYPGIGLCPFSKAYTTEGAADIDKQIYAANNGTEIRVDRIQGNSEKFDLLINAPFVHTRTASRNLNGGFVKTGTGTLALVNTDSTFAGDVTVSGGTLMLATNAYSSTQSVDASILGKFKGDVYPTDWTLGGRTITAENGGVIEFCARNFWPGYGSASSDPLNVRFVVKNDGKLKFRKAAFNVIPNLTVEGGQIEVEEGYAGCGSFKVLGPMTVKGTRPFDLSYRGSPIADSSSRPGIMMFYSPRTEFDVADVTCDGAPDMTLGIPVFRNGNAEEFLSEPMAFKKTGQGTMRYTANRIGIANFDLTGDCDVEGGTLLIDGDAFFGVTAKIASGAYVGGTGTVQNVMLAAGAGFAATAGQKAELCITGDLTIPATGVVEISNPDGLPLNEVGARIAKVSGTFTRPTDLSGWRVTVNGQQTSLPVYVSGDGLRAGARPGFCINVR